jgi:hypothetical protein
VLDITRGADDSVYVLGTFSGAVDFDPGPEERVKVARGATDWFVTKFGLRGEYGWTQTFSGDLAFERIAAVGADGVVAVGAYSGVVDFDPGGTERKSMAGGSDWEGFALRLNRHGEFVRVYLLPTTGTASSVVTGVAVDQDGSAFIIGVFSGTVEFNPDGASMKRTASANKDGFVAKLTPTGTTSWTRVLAGSGSVGTGIIRLGSNGELAVAAFFVGAVDLDPGPASQEVSGTTSVFALRMSKEGALSRAWAWTGGTGIKDVRAIGISGDGTTVVAGNFTEGTMDLDPTQGVDLRSPTDPSANSMFIVTLDPAGGYRWGRAFSGAAPQVLSAGAVTNGAFLAAGHFLTTRFEVGRPGVTSFLDRSAGAAFFAQFGLADGKTIAAGNFGSGSMAVMAGAGAGDRFIVTGWFTGTGDFDPGRAVDRLASGAPTAFVWQVSR